MARDTGEPQGINREAVIDAAMELLHQVGIDGLSMRGLAERLGVKAASLYWHVRDKEQVLEFLADALLDRVAVPRGGSWRERVTAACTQLGALLRDREAAALLLACLPVLQRSRLAGELTRILSDAGLPEAGGVAFALLVDVVASASVAPVAAAPSPGGERTMTLAIDSGSYRVAVRSGAADMLEPAASVGGGGAASLEMRETDRVIVRGRRGGNRGAVLLNPRYAWHIKVHGGTWNTTLDLTGLQLRGMELDSGAGNVSADLPSPPGIVPIKVNSGLVGVTLRRPRSAAIHALVHSGSVKVRFDGRPLRVTPVDMQWESPGASRSSDRYELTVHSGCVKVSMDASAPERAVPRAEAAASDPAGTAAPHDSVDLILDGIDARLKCA